MSGADPVRERLCAVEIAAALNGCRVGLCGYDIAEAQRLANALRDGGIVAVPLDERLVADSARVCDVVVARLASLTTEGLKSVVLATVPILVTGPSRMLIEGAGAAYCWAGDFMDEPWTEAGLLLRLFRLIEFGGRSASYAAPDPRNEPLVLLADDDPDLTTLVSVTLHNDGIACRIATDGLAALRLARQLSPDLMVLDVRMPSLDGFGVLETVRLDPALEGVPVILLTACDDPADVVRGARLAADQYLAKPLSPNSLLVRVRRLLALNARSAKRWDRTMPQRSTPQPGGATPRRWVQSGPAGKVAVKEEVQ